MLTPWDIGIKAKLLKSKTQTSPSPQDGNEPAHWLQALTSTPEVHTLHSSHRDLRKIGVRACQLLVSITVTHGPVSPGPSPPLLRHHRAQTPASKAFPCWDGMAAPSQSLRPISQLTHGPSPEACRQARVCFPEKQATSLPVSLHHATGRVCRLLPNKI